MYDHMIFYSALLFDSSSIPISVDAEIGSILQSWLGDDTAISFMIDALFILTIKTLKAIANDCPSKIKYLSAHFEPGDSIHVIKLFDSLNYFVNKVIIWKMNY